MTNDAGSDRDSRDSRRWMIGVGISLAFGLFGVLMALLNYSARTAQSGGSKAAPQIAAPAPTSDHPGKGNGKK